MAKSRAERYATHKSGRHTLWQQMKRLKLHLLRCPLKYGRLRQQKEKKRVASVNNHSCQSIVLYSVSPYDDYTNSRESEGSALALMFLQANLKTSDSAMFHLLHPWIITNLSYSSLLRRQWLCISPPWVLLSKIRLTVHTPTQPLHGENSKIRQEEMIIGTDWFKKKKKTVAERHLKVIFCWALR